MWSINEDPNYIQGTRMETDNEGLLTGFCLICVVFNYYVQELLTIFQIHHYFFGLISFPDFFLSYI